jgi:hypothetical protein
VGRAQDGEDSGFYDPMIEYVLLGRWEIDLDRTNGFIVMRRKEFGIECPTHEGMIQMVKEQAVREAAKARESAENTNYQGVATSSLQY